MWHILPLFGTKGKITIKLTVLLELLRLQYEHSKRYEGLRIAKKIEPWKIVD